jgi:hypothetical protein
MLSFSSRDTLSSSFPSLSPLNPTPVATPMRHVHSALPFLPRASVRIARHKRGLPARKSLKKGYTDICCHFEPELSIYLTSFGF